MEKGGGKVGRKGENQEEKKIQIRKVTLTLLLQMTTQLLDAPRFGNIRNIY